MATGADHGAMDAVTWFCVRKRHAYSRKFYGHRLSAEPLNPNKRHSFKSCGFLSNSVGVVRTPGGKPRVVISQRRKGGRRVGSKLVLRLGADPATRKAAVRAVVDAGRADIATAVDAVLKKAVIASRNLKTAA